MRKQDTGSTYTENTGSQDKLKQTGQIPKGWLAWRYFERGRDYKPWFLKALTGFRASIFV